MYKKNTHEKVSNCHRFVTWSPSCTSKYLQNSKYTKYLKEKTFLQSTTCPQNGSAKFDPSDVNWCKTIKKTLLALIKTLSQDKILFQIFYNL